MDRLIDTVVKKRIEEAAADCDTKLLAMHLTDSYDEYVHRAVYRALGCIGTRESIAVLMQAAMKNNDSETEKVIAESLTDAFSAQSVAIG